MINKKGHNPKKEIRDVENPHKEFDTLMERFRLLSRRFQAIAMDYKFYINSDVSDFEIYNLRDNVLYRMKSARLLFDMLLMYHTHVEKNFRELYKEDQADFWRSGAKFTILHEISSEEIYTLFDSLLYHLCSTFDYLFRLINFSHGNVVVDNPKWNLFKADKNLKKFVFCSKELIPKLDKIDAQFVYPLIKHRSHLIHTSNDSGDFRLDTNFEGTNFDVKFFATKLFKETFPEIEKENENCHLTIKFAALWSIDKTIKAITEVLFELSDDMKRNRKPQPYVSGLRGDDGTIQPISSAYWGDRAES